jgi:spore maturation protein CgeB
MDMTLRKYRRAFRFWRNDLRLRGELARYEALFDARRLSLPGEDRIHGIMADRFPHLKAKRKGTLNIIAIYHHYNWENESLKPSLGKFGTVRHYDWGGQFDHQREKEWHRSVRVAMNSDMVRRIGQWIEEAKADVIFTYLSGELVVPHTLHEIRNFGLPLINLSLNDKENFAGKIREGRAMGMKDICRCFDLCWTSTADALKKYCVEEALPLYLPEGANPEIHKPSPVEKTIDVSFVGQCYGNRREIIDRLRGQGIKVEAYGSGWPNGPLATETMVRMYSRSRINLGFGGVSGHRGACCLKGRDFEIPMSGGLYLTEYHRELEHVYAPDEIVTYQGFDDLVGKIRFLLASPEKAEEIRKRGFERARASHTWEMRFEKVFGLLGLI